MVERAALLASMPYDEKSVKNLVTKDNLRSAVLLDPHRNVKDMADSTTEESLPNPPTESVQ